MNITVNDKIKILRWNQEVSIDTMEQFSRNLEQITSCDEKMIILDLSDVVFMNSEGLDLLSHTVIQINQQQKELVLVGIVNPLAEIFQSANIDVFVKCFSNQNDAIEYFLYTDQ